MVWSHEGVGNWYKNASGRVLANSPWRLVDYWNVTREFASADYLLTYRAHAAGARVGAKMSTGWPNSKEERHEPFVRAAAPDGCRGA
jgi:hypothetical protein